MIWTLIAILGTFAAILIGAGGWELWKKRSAKQAAARTASQSGHPKVQQPPNIYGSGCALTFGLVWVSLSLVFVVVGLGWLASEWTTYTLLRESGVTTEAVIISRRIDTDSDGDSFFITYRYNAPLPQGDRGAFTNEESVSRSRYEEHPPETRVTIRYAADHPETARLASSSITGPILFALFFTVFGGIFTFVGVAMVAGGVKNLSQARALAYRGVTAQARLVERWTEQDSDGDPLFCVAYRFTAPGHPEVFKAEYNRRAYNHPDDTVSVRYLPHQPQICRLEV
ncbi:MAG: DUF3592 domain-containing protein [Anaerolineaceae bacterium]|nr:DUF3592 domain-containing protein [Anaerolineaceae bacterium]MCB9101050.1 DUF3592 domain-containing protein [Anaerolineales bacterium]